MPTPPPPLDLDPVDVFAKLVRECDAGRALIAMTPLGEPRRRAAVDALALARDVLDDARQLLDPTADLDARMVDAVHAELLRTLDGRAL